MSVDCHSGGFLVSDVRTECHGGCPSRTQYVRNHKTITTSKYKVQRDKLASISSAGCLAVFSLASGHHFQANNAHTPRNVVGSTYVMIRTDRGSTASLTTKPYNQPRPKATRVLPWYVALWIWHRDTTTYGGNQTETINTAG